MRILFKFCCQKLILLMLSLALIWTPEVILAHGDVQLRIAKLTKKINQFSDANLLVRRGRLWRDDEKLAPALSDFKRALSLDPRHKNALYYGAKTALESGLNEDAQVMSERFFTEVKNAGKKAAIFRAYQLSADVHLAKGDKKNAIVLMKKSLGMQLHPSPDHWIKLIDLQFQFEGYSSALKTLKMALTKSGSNVVLQQKIIDFAIANRDYETAISYLDMQLDKSASLRKVVLLVKKSDVLLLADNQVQAAKFREQAKNQFNKLSAGKKNQPAARQLQPLLAMP